MSSKFFSIEDLSDAILVHDLTITRSCFNMNTFFSIDRCTDNQLQNCFNNKMRSKYIPYSTMYHIGTGICTFLFQSGVLWTTGQLHFEICGPLLNSTAVVDCHIPSSTHPHPHPHPHPTPNSTCIHVNQPLMHKTVAQGMELTTLYIPLLALSDGG